MYLKAFYILLMWCCNRFGQLMGLFKDPVQTTIWTFTEKAVFKYKVIVKSQHVQFYGISKVTNFLY